MDGEISTEFSFAVDQWKKLGPLDFAEMYRTLIKDNKNKEKPKDRVLTNNDRTLKFGNYNYPHNLYQYTGQLDAATGKPHGLGRRVSSKSNRIIEGQFYEGIPSGFARYIWDNGDYYLGMQNDTLANGYGKLVKINGTIQDGEWKEWKFIK